LSARFKLLVFSAVAQDDEEHRFATPFGTQVHIRRAGEALHPSREPLEVLEEQQRLLGLLFYSAQYLQAPMPIQGNLVSPAWFRRYGSFDLHGIDRVIQSWDTASKASQLNDYSVCVTCAIKGERIYLLDVFRERLDLPALRRRVIEHAVHHHAEVVLIEEAGSGIGLLQELRAAHFYKGMPVVPKGDKVSRFNGVTPMIEQGRVYLPETASWEEGLIRELCGFPKTRHDDQVDALSQALHWIREHGCPGGIFEHYRREDEARRAYEENHDVQLQAPVGVSHADLIDGHEVPVDPDGMIWVRGKDAAPLIRGGFRRVGEDD